MSTPRGHLRAAILLTGLLVIATVALGAIQSVMGFYLSKLPIEAPGGLQFHSLPREIPVHDPVWRQLGRDEVLSKEGADELGTSNYLSRWYAKQLPDGEQERVQLHCAYYTGMIDTVPHVPERCLVGGGLVTSGVTELVKLPLSMKRLIPDPDLEADGSETIWTARSALSHSRVRLPRGIEDLSLRVTPFRDQADEGRIVTGYFFIANGQVYKSANDLRIRAFGLSARYAYWVKIQFMSPTVEDAEELAELSGEMLDELFPEIMRRLPDWIEVEAGRYPPSEDQREGSDAAM